MASSPFRTHFSKHAMQQPLQAPALSNNERAFPVEQGFEDEEDQGDIQEDVDHDTQEYNDHVNQDDAEPSGDEEDVLNSILDSMPSIVSTIDRRTDPASGDEDSDPEEDHTDD